MKRGQSVTIIGLLLLSIAESASAQPNVVLIMTDDQGYGDLGVNGNPIIRTPNLDAFARESVRVDPFYVNPVCSPTRAALLTGRYNYRTGVVDTYIGRSMMHPDEVTLAEMLHGAGYRTGIFGKWHLGDNYPLRPIEQGFDVALVHKGGGIKQPSDPPEGTSYFNPVVYRNGVEGPSEGYCTDVFTDGAIEFIQRESDKPFFVYLPYNAPHNPLDVADEYADPYHALDLDVDDFPATRGRSIEGRFNAENTARVYGMIANIDYNVGRLLETIDARGLRDNTIVIFMTDNGPQHPRYNAGLRGRKGTVFEGGIRVPFFVRWPGHLDPGRVVTSPGAHIDVTPTLLDACNVAKPDGVLFDGHSLLPALQGAEVTFANRPLAFQWHRGNTPERFRAFALRQGRYKLVQPDGVAPNAQYDANALMLFDLEADPYERVDLAAERPDVVAALKASYEAWFDDVSSTRGYGPIRIIIGADQEPVTTLTRQDWRGPDASWSDDGIGSWYVTVDRPGLYDFLLQFPERDVPARVTLHVAGLGLTRSVIPGDTSVRFGDVRLPDGDTAIKGTVESSGSIAGVHYITVERSR